MTLNISVPAAETELKPRIVVVGTGGAGGNAVENMIRSQLEGVEFLVANTDAQTLSQSSAERKIQLGINATHGLGAGSRPDVGRAAAEEGLDQIVDHLQGSHMVFITAGMGGGTGTGGAPVIARAARELGILTVGVVTKPFHFEGARRMHIAEEGMQELQHYVDTLIIIPNQNLFRVANEKTTFADAFKMADDVLYSGVRGVTDLMVMPGLINLDFADIRSVMGEMGKAMMGTGEADGEKRALDAAEAAISNPLLDDISMNGAHGVLINITGGPDMTLFEVDEAANRIRDEVDPEANIIFGSTFDENLEGRMRISVVATGIDAQEGAMPRPTSLSLITDQGKRVALEREARDAEELALTGIDIGAELPELGALAVGADAPLALGDGAEVAPTSDLRDRAVPPPAEDPVDKTEETDAGAPEATHESEISGTIADDPFIPPRAEESSSRPAEMPPPDPFAAAAVANGGKGPTKRKKRGPSLFARVTGVARTAQPAAAAASTAPPKPVQSKLGGLDPTDRIKTSESEEEDLLDIPAFLRRQAN